MVGFTVGPGRWDPTCIQNSQSLPHFAVGTTSSLSERNFASGNERTPAEISKWASQGKKAGYQINKEDKFRVIVDLMNMNMEDRVVYLTMTYDYVEGKLPADYMDIKPIWFDADQCGMSEIHPPKEKGSFDVPAKAWYPNFEGEMVVMGGHLHDGGTTAQMFVNNALICDSKAAYSEKPEYVYKSTTAMPMGEKFAENHISSMNVCFFDQKQKKLDKSEAWTLKGFYDYDKYTGNLEGSGEQADIMSIAIAYAAVKQGGVPMPK